MANQQVNCVDTVVVTGRERVRCRHGGVRGHETSRLDDDEMAMEGRLQWKECVCEMIGRFYLSVMQTVLEQGQNGRASRVDGSVRMRVVTLKHSPAYPIVEQVM